MVGELSAREPLVPVVGGRDEHGVRLVVGRGGAVVVPRQRDERDIAIVHRRARGGAAPLEPEAQVGPEPQRLVECVRPVDRRDGLPVTVALVLPGHAVLAVARPRIALERHLDRPVHAAQRAQQDVLGVVVGGRASVCRGAFAVVPPGADEQDVADDDPARPGTPRRLQDHGPGQVAPPGRDVGVGGGDLEAACVTVEDRAEDGRPVHPRQTHPFDVPARSDERRDLAVAEKRVVGDGRKGAATQGHVPDELSHGLTLCGRASPRSGSGQAAAGDPSLAATISR